LGSDPEVLIFAMEMAPAVQGFDSPRAALRRLRWKVFDFPRLFSAPSASRRCEPSFVSAANNLDLSMDEQGC
jgi:hypothetical protein